MCCGKCADKSGFLRDIRLDLCCSKIKVVCVQRSLQLPAEIDQLNGKRRRYGVYKCLKNTSASFSIVEQTVSMVTTAGVIPLCVVAKLIASSRNNGSVQAGHIHWSTLIHV